LKLDIRNSTFAMTAAEWKRELELEPHPEGGAYRETYRSDVAFGEEALPDAFDGERNAAAHIYFLLEAGTFSALHRIRQDELWHVYDGGPATLHVIEPEGRYHTETLGRNVAAGHRLHTVVPAGCWFGVTVEAGDGPGHFLAGCTTAPAFDFADFELADREALTQQFPQHEAVIRKLTRV
jgi:predicted cupin superfamily sugar epimerase